MKKIGVIDTTFARIDTGSVAVRELEALSEERGWPCRVTRRTVPGFKDLAAGCVRLFDDEGFDICLAIGWVGGMPVDAQCAHEASMSIANAQLMLRRHILEVFVHEIEATEAERLRSIAIRRAAEHARNALYLLFDPDQLVGWAGMGRRQGDSSVGPLVVGSLFDHHATLTADPLAGKTEA